MLRLTICDDEPVSLAFFQSLAADWAKQTKTEVKIDLCKNADQFLFLWEEKKDIDILLLDIEMPGMDGISLAHKLREMGESLQIIFVTGVADYVLEGYDVDAVSYLLKPVKRERLFFCLDKAKGRCRKGEAQLVLETAGEIVRVRLSDICYLESEAHDTLLYRSGLTEPIRLKTGILQMEQKLREKSGAFYKVHRSYLIHLAHVERISKKEVTMDNGAAVPIARGRWEACNQAYLNYYRGRQE